MADCFIKDDFSIRVYPVDQLVSYTRVQKSGQAIAGLAEVVTPASTNMHV